MASYYRFGKWIFHPYSDYNVARRGRRDGSLDPPIPAWVDKRQPPYVVALKQLGDSSLRRVGEEWSAVNTKLKAEIDSLEAELRHRKELEEEAEQHREQAADAYQKEHEEPPPASRSPLFWYWFWLGVFGIAELPMNSVVFRLFGDSAVLTYATAAAVGLTLVVCAHSLGGMLKEGDYERKTNRWIVGMLILVPVIVVASVSWLREAYLLGNPDMPQNVTGASLYLSFAGFNLVILLAGVVLSYHAHERALDRLLAREKNLKRSRTGRAELEKELAQVTAEREKLFQVYHLRGMQIKDGVERLTATYRTHNLERRKDRGEHTDETQPHSFLEAIEVKVPEHLREIDASTKREQAKQVKREEAET